MMALTSLPVRAAEIHVPRDADTIQLAVDMAVDGDEVVIAPGVYEESVDLLGKAWWPTAGCWAGATLHMLDSMLERNEATAAAGGIDAQGDVLLVRANICGNLPTQVQGTYEDGGAVVVLDDACLGPQVPAPYATGPCCLPIGCVESTFAQCRAAEGIVLAAPGATCADRPATCGADLNGDGVVDVADLLAVLAGWM